MTKIAAAPVFLPKGLLLICRERLLPEGRDCGVSILFPGCLAAQNTLSLISLRS